MLRIWGAVTAIVETITVIPGIAFGAWTPFIGGTIAVLLLGSLWGVLSIIDPM